MMAVGEFLMWVLFLGAGALVSGILLGYVLFGRAIKRLEATSNCSHCAYRDNDWMCSKRGIKIDGAVIDACLADGCDDYMFRGGVS